MFYCQPKCRFNFDPHWSKTTPNLQLTVAHEIKKFGHEIEIYTLQYTQECKTSVSHFLPQTYDAEHLMIL